MTPCYSSSPKRLCSMLSCHAELLSIAPRYFLLCLEVRRGAFINFKMCMSLTMTILLIFGLVVLREMTVQLIDGEKNI